MRAAGVLLPIASLPSAYGIGTFSKEAYKFVDFLKEAGQTYWQILPLGPTGYGDSPYQSFSTFAGNPYYIDLEEFITKGYLTKEECEDIYDYISQKKEDWEYAIENGEDCDDEFDYWFVCYNACKEIIPQKLIENSITKTFYI